MITHGLVIGILLSLTLALVCANAAHSPRFAGMLHRDVRDFLSYLPRPKPVSFMSAAIDGAGREGAPGRPTAEFEPKSWISELLGLDKHPATLAAINNTLRTVATAAGIPSSVVGLPNATATDPTGTGSTLGATVETTSPTTILQSIEDAGVSVGVPALKSIVAQLALQVPDLTAAEQTALASFTDSLIDNVAAGITK